jgi:hypothetical protein
MKKKTLLTAALSSVFSFSAFAGLKRFSLAMAIPLSHVWICEGDVPDRCTEPPLFLVLSPENYTVHAVATVSLSLLIVARTSDNVFSWVLFHGSHGCYGHILLVYFRKREG